MQFLVSALGSAGDVHPFIAISQALLARGHGVRLLAAPHFEARVRQAGIDFHPAGSNGDYERVVQRAELWHPRRGARLLLDELLDHLPDAHARSDALATGPGTVLVGSTLSWNLRLVQERRGLPFATVHLSPICLPSSTLPPVLPGIGDLAGLPAWSLRLLLRAAESLVTDRLIAPRLDRLRASLGLPPVRRILSRWMHSPDLVIGAWPEWFAPAQPDWPPQTRLTGFPLFGEAGGLDATTESFLAAGSAPIGITPGSAMAHGHAFFQRAIEACGALGRRALLITPYREQLPAALPDWALPVAYAPFSALLPRLSALVHHGGIGTSAQALAAGIPQLVLPFAHDQFDNAARLHRLGVAATLRRSASPAELAAALDVLGQAGTCGAVRNGAARMASGHAAAEHIAMQLEELGRGRAG